jgi:putative two-component system response regulator
MIEPNLREAAILVVDDHQMNVRLLEMMLKAEGYSMTCGTTDPREVVPLYRDFRPDLVVLDLHMPEVDGFAVLEQLMRTGQDTPPCVLVLTSDVSPVTHRRALNAGAAHFLTKPIDRRDLLEHIARMLRRALLQKQRAAHGTSPPVNTRS